MYNIHCDFSIIIDIVISMLINFSNLYQAEQSICIKFLIIYYNYLIIYLLHFYCAVSNMYKYHSMALMQEQSNASVHNLSVRQEREDYREERPVISDIFIADCKRKSSKSSKLL